MFFFICLLLCGFASMEEFPAVLSWTWWMEGLDVTRAREWDYRIVLGYPESFVQSFWCQRHQPLAFFYVTSHGSSLSRECQYMSCNYRRNTHGVMKILNACWFKHTFVYYVYKCLVLLCQKHRRDVYVYSGASICEQIRNSWWQISCMSSSLFTFASLTEVL